MNKYAYKLVKQANITKTFETFLFLIIFSLGPAITSSAAKAVVLFSDMTDGPTSGWEGSNTKGAAVTIWGLNFGSARGTSTLTACGVTLNQDSDFAEWGTLNKPGFGEDPNDVYSSARGLQRITFWLKSSMTTGPGTISVTTSEGTSTTIPFYCRSLGTNKIYFISRTGIDSNNGLYSTQASGINGPWFSAKKVRDLQAGDIACFRSGLWNESDGAYGAVIYFNKNHQNGIENKSISIASYPGEIAQLGDNSNKSTVRHSGDGEILSYWTFSKFKMRANVGVTNWGLNANASNDHIRFVGNDASTTSGGSSIFHLDGGQGGMTYFYLYGNYSHDAGVDKRGDTGPSAYPLYFTGYGFHNYIYVGWNEFAYNGNGRGMQVYGHQVGDWIDNLYVHDNWIHNNGKTGAVLGGGDPSTNYQFVRNVYFYNNIVAFNGSLGYPGILMGGEFGGGNDGNWNIYNNTFYQNESGEIYVSTGSSPNSIIMKNNIIVPKSGKSYYSGKTGSFFTGSNNLYYGAGNGPLWDSNRLDNLNPQFVNPETENFHLQATSPAIDAGTSAVNTIVPKDFDGNPRTVGEGFDIGVYEYQTDADYVAPQPPSNLRVLY